VDSMELFHEVAEQAKEIAMINAWNKVLLMGFYLHPDAKLFESFHNFCDTRGLDREKTKALILFPQTYLVNMSIRRFISGYVPRLAKVCYNHTSKEALKILKWMDGRKLVISQEGQLKRECMLRHDGEADYAAYRLSAEIRQSQWDGYTAKAWNNCK